MQSLIKEFANFSALELVSRLNRLYSIFQKWLKNFLFKFLKSCNNGFILNNKTEILCKFFPKNIRHNSKIVFDGTNKKKVSHYFVGKYFQH